MGITGWGNQLAGKKKKVITQKIILVFNEINKKLKEHAIMKL